MSDQITDTKYTYEAEHSVSLTALNLSSPVTSYPSEEEPFRSIIFTLSGEFGTVGNHPSAGTRCASYRAG